MLFHNAISLLRHEQVSLIRLRFERLFHDVKNLLYYEH